MANSTQMEIVSRIRGYHIYQAIWQAALGKTLDCIRETHNCKDRYAVSVIKDGQVIGHLPKEISKISSLFWDVGEEYSVKSLEADAIRMICHKVV